MLDNSSYFFRFLSFLDIVILVKINIFVCFIGKSQTKEKMEHKYPLTPYYFFYVRLGPEWLGKRFS